MEDESEELGGAVCLLFASQGGGEEFMMKEKNCIALRFVLNTNDCLRVKETTGPTDWQ